jgi:hypothetical protein
MPNEDAFMLDRSGLNEALKAKHDCLTPPELEKLVEDSSVENSHVAECSRCQTELALLKSFESNEPLPGEGAAVAWISARLERQLGQIKSPGASQEADVLDPASSWLSRLFRGRTTRWLVPVTAVLIVAMASFSLMHQSREPQLRADAGSGPIVYRSQEIEVVAPVGNLVDAPKTLQWKPLPGAAKYQVSIMEVDEVALWTGEINDSILTIPIAVRAKLLPGKPVLWRVTALDSQGRVLAASQLQRFSVQLKSSGSTSGVLSR